MTKDAKHRRTAVRATKRQKASVMRRAAALAREEAIERKAEAIAPKVQRNDVVAPDGRVVRGARLIPDGVTFIRSNPIARMFARGQAKGDQATVRKSHLDACERLIRAWEDGGEGIGSVPSLLDERGGSLPVTGWISDQKIAAIDYQSRARLEFAGALTWMGALWPVIKRVALDGADLATWAKEAQQDPDVARGYLMAALDRLVEFYLALDQPKRRRSVTI